MRRVAFGPALVVTLSTQGAAVVAGAIVGSYFGWDCAQSVLAGGFALWLPNAALAAYLWARARVVRVLGVGVFLAGEGLKLAASIALLVGAVRALGEAAVWPGILAGIFLALKGQWLAVWFTRNI
jgi:F0F1-type ATP synthase assembly protein I